MSTNSIPTSNGSIASTEAMHHSDRVQYVEEENRKLRDEIESLKRLFQGVQVQANPDAPLTPVAQNSQRRKSVTPRQLKKDNPDFDLETVDLDNVANKLLTSCYDLARCLMGRPNATSPVPNPPSDQERTKIEGFFTSSETLPSNSSGLRIQLRELVPISSNPKIDSDYVRYVHATMRRWGINRFTMDWDKHWDDRLRRNFKRGQKGDATLAQDQEKNTQRQSLKRKSIAHQLYLQEQGVHARFVEPFDNKYVNSDDELALDNNTPIALSKTPTWRSEKATAFIDWIEARRRAQRVPTSILAKKINYGSKALIRPRKRPDVPIFDDQA
ncbi:hypothetical protein PtB15_18B3 [Puccinia triticina]|nr:hypothetical protein PtB15_18B3 [Puccinia triticina]